MLREHIIAIGMWEETNQQKFTKAQYPDVCMFHVFYIF